VSSIFRAEILTVFPEMIEGYLSKSILGKARERQLIDARGIDIRDYARGRHRQTDDVPYGGGGGMVMKVGPIAAAIEDARMRLPQARVLLMSPRGSLLTQSKVRELAQHQGGLILVCGRYEGVDDRVRSYVDEELSVGDFVITGGELAALIVVDAVARLFPGVLGNECSPANESFSSGTLEYPHYTRPPEFRGDLVPAVLQSGNHDRIARWRRWQELNITRQRRPDLFASLVLSEADRQLLGLAEDEL
jgi:tRNA (guanine37-N1)-methyltransferase